MNGEPVICDAGTESDGEQKIMPFCAKSFTIGEFFLLDPSLTNQFRFIVLLVNGTVFFLGPAFSSLVSMAGSVAFCGSISHVCTFLI